MNYCLQVDGAITGGGGGKSVKKGEKGGAFKRQFTVFSKTKRIIIIRAVTKLPMNLVKGAA